MLPRIVPETLLRTAESPSINFLILSALYGRPWGM